MIIQPSYQTYLDAKQILTNGDLVAFPTETVYGLGANALDILAVKKIFETKKRPQRNPIIVHVGSIDQIGEYAEIISPFEEKIINTLMPGPITILLKKKKIISDIVTAGSEFVGIRIPSNKVALDFLQTVELPVAAPSANISTKPSPTSAQMVESYFHEAVPMIIDGGACDVGIESTVVKVEGSRIVITRPGFITAEDIQSLFPENIQVEYAQSISEITPGNMFKHYSPNSKIQLLQNTNQIPFPLSNSKTAILVTQERIDNHKDRVTQFVAQNGSLYLRGTKSHLLTCAKSLFSFYHQADKDHISDLFVEPLEEKGLGYAIMNRVKKSTE
ncbi:MAG: L-threonylcarbamoyladenylate synthase [Candidatus Absconditabacteria bacterium]|nr:L-threonylcarbamoyladenylate synthase [Candidatus Absconditabacteria bacterium]